MSPAPIIPRSQGLRRRHHEPVNVRSHHSHLPAHAARLQSILEKAVAHAETRKFDPNVLVASRLYPDMLSLNRQVQIASDAAKGAAARLSGTEPPKFEDNETTMPELIARVTKTIDYLQSFKAEQFTGADSRVITIKSPRNTFNFTAVDFVRHWAMPNFFFHVTTAYALLRHSGVEIGKMDFLGVRAAGLRPRAPHAELQLALSRLRERVGVRVLLLFLFDSYSVTVPLTSFATTSSG